MCKYDRKKTTLCNYIVPICYGFRYKEYFTAITKVINVIGKKVPNRSIINLTKSYCEWSSVTRVSMKQWHAVR